MRERESESESESEEREKEREKERKRERGRDRESERERARESERARERERRRTRQRRRARDNIHDVKKESLMLVTAVCARAFVIKLVTASIGIAPPTFVKTITIRATRKLVVATAKAVANALFFSAVMTVPKLSMLIATLLQCLYPAPRCEIFGEGPFSSFSFGLPLAGQPHPFTHSPRSDWFPPGQSPLPRAQSVRH